MKIIIRVFRVVELIALFPLIIYLSLVRTKSIRSTRDELNREFKKWLKLFIDGKPF